MPDEGEIEPKIEQISFSGRLASDLPTIKQMLSSIPFYSFQLSPDKLDVIRVESRNIRKKPFLFYIISIKQDTIDLTYSIVPGSSDRLRRAVVIKNLTSLLASISESFQVDESKFFQYVDSVMDNILNDMSQSYSALFNKYDALINEYAEIKRLSRELTVSNRNLTIQTGQLNDENKRLAEQLKALQTYSDDALMAMVEDWIEVHNSSIDVGEFAKTYKVSEPRVEQILDKMVSMGYVELKS